MLGSASLSGFYETFRTETVSVKQLLVSVHIEKVIGSSIRAWSQYEARSEKQLSITESIFWQESLTGWSKNI
jgi:hypothetical protein